MDLSNGNDGRDVNGTPYGTPYPEQQPRFRRSTPMNEAREGTETVSQAFSFSPIYDNHSVTLPDSGFGSYMPSPSNVGSPVLYKSPVQHGETGTERSEFVTADGSELSCAPSTCVKRMLTVLKTLLYGVTLAVLAVLCFWCARKSSAFNTLIMTEDCMLYIVVATTAVIAVLVTALLTKTVSETSSNASKWDINNSNIYQRRAQTQQSPCKIYNQYPNQHQEQQVLSSPMTYFTPDTPTDRNLQANPAIVRSSEARPSGGLNNERKPSIGESVGRTTSATPVAARSGLVDHVTADCTARKYRQEQQYSYSPIVPDTPLDRNWQATPAPMRSSDVSPSGILKDDRKPSTGETDWTATASPAIARSSVGSPMTPECTESRSHVSETTIERSGIQTPTVVRSDTVAPHNVKLQDVNNNQIGAYTGINDCTSSCKTMTSQNDNEDITFTRGTEITSTETGGFAARRTFSGSGSDVWLEFIRYFENLMALNNWSQEKARRIFLCLLRGQAESFAYGLPYEVQSNWKSLKGHMEERFGLLAMRDSYIAEAKLRRKKADENFRDFGQAVESLFRRAYPESLDVIRENALTTFLENCSDSADFRMAVKRTKPQTLQEAVKNAIQEECIRLGESDKKNKPAKPVFDLGGDANAAYGRDTYQRNRKPWQRREQSGGRSNTRWNKSFHNDDGRFSKKPNDGNSSNMHETKRYK